jgi:hypothetical protein
MIKNIIQKCTMLLLPSEYGDNWPKYAKVLYKYIYWVTVDGVVKSFYNN